MTYLRLEEITYGEAVDATLIQELLDLDLVTYRCPDQQVVEVAEADGEDLRTMLRLATQLKINAAGVETIMHMRRRMVSLQSELRYLRSLQR